MKLFELFAELTLDAGNFNKGIDSAGKQGKSLASSLSGGFSAVSAKTIALGHALYDVGKQAAKAAIDFTKAVVTEVADTEQLIGGVETLFQGSAGTVVKNAQNAFRTAGMSANEYMETVTAFSASLLQSLDGDTAAAAKAADMAVQDMSDNANKMGTDMGLIQNAYQGFAKQNYTMLDNLKLGYGGTKTEMERLLKDAEAIQRAQGKNVKYSLENLDDVYEAIHVVQTEMGITGTTAKEAATTISGSFNAFKASWKNLLAGMGTDQEMGELIDNLFDTGEQMVTNLMALVPKIGSRALQAVDAALQRFDLYRTLKNAYRVGKWEGLADAAVESFKRGVKGFGEWALDVGSNFLASVLSGLTGNEESADKIKAILKDVFSAAGDILTGLGSTFKDTLAWILNNWTKLAPIVSAMGVAFAALAVKANPLTAIMTALSGAIVLLTTDWDTFEENNPRVVQMFEDLTKLDFDNFKSGVESVKTALESISTWAAENTDVIKTLMALIGGLAIYAGHPAVGAGLIGASWGIESENIVKTKTHSILKEGTSTEDHGGGGLRFDGGSGEITYTRDQLQDALNQLHNATPSETPAVITGPDGQTINKWNPSGKSVDDENISGTIDSLTTAIAAFQSAASTIPQEAASAAASAAAGTLSGAKIEMDGSTVGSIVFPYVSANMARQGRVVSKAHG